MDSVKLYTLQELAPVIKFSYAALRNRVVADRLAPSRGTLRLQYAELPVFRLGGKSWLARAADVDALINPPAAPTADADETPATTTRRPGRPRKGAPLAALADGGAQ